MPSVCNKGGAGMIVEEAGLKSDISAGRIKNVYFLYGKEPFLVKTYTDKIVKKTVGDDPIDFNLIKLASNPDAGTLIDYVEGLPVFADMKVVIVNDVKPDTLDPEDYKAYLDIIGNVPDTTVLIFSITGIELNDTKKAVKDFISAVGKAGTVCRLDGVPENKIVDLVVRKAAKGGIVIAPEDAAYLSERVLCDMTLVSSESSKLMDYVGRGGVITRDVIDKLVGKHLDTSVFELATAINAGERENAFRIVDDLFAQRISAVNILSAMTGAYLDLYRAKVAKMTGVLPAQAAEQLGYPKNRDWVVKRSMTAVSHLRLGYLRETLFILSEADTEIKSMPLDARVIFDKTVTKLFLAGEKRYA